MITSKKHFLVSAGCLIGFALASTINAATYTLKKASTGTYITVNASHQLVASTTNASSAQQFEKISYDGGYVIKASGGSDSGKFSVEPSGASRQEISASFISSAEVFTDHSCDGNTVYISSSSTSKTLKVESNNMIGNGSSGTCGSSANVFEWTEVSSSSAFTIPGTIEAEDFESGYDTTSGNSGKDYKDVDNVDIQNTSDSSGSYNVGWIKSGEWLEYPINISSSGDYLLEARVSSPYATGKFNIEIDGSTKGSITIDKTGNWNTWKTQSVTLKDLSSGTHTLRIAMTGSDFNLNWLKFSASDSSSSISIPGTIEAEDFASGYDTTSGNSGKDYKDVDNVDIQSTSDSSGAYNVGWIKSGEWLEYPINVSSTDSYMLAARVSSPYTTGKFDIEIDGAYQASISVNKTGSWDTWKTQDVKLGTLSSGSHTLRIAITGSNFNLNWLEVTVTDDSNNIDQPSTSLDPNKAPCQNFDLDTVWKLTEPTGDEVKEELCPDYEDIGYFYTESDGAMTFQVDLDDPNGGVTKSAHYWRSELRELYNFSYSGESGKFSSTSDANWNNEGTHRMTGTAQVTEYESGDPQTVFAQIHAETSQAYLKMQWDGSNAKIRAIMNEDPDTKSAFSIEFDVTPGTNKIDYTIEQKDNTLTVTVSSGSESDTKSMTFGQSFTDRDGDSRTLKTSWDSQKFYFKAGNYAQANVDDYDGTFIVKYYDLQLYHSEYTTSTK